VSLTTAAVYLSLPAGALAGPAETAVTVLSNPLIVYTVVGVLLGAVVAAIFAARPWRGWFALRSPVPPSARSGVLPPMPGGDIFATPEQPTPVEPPSPPPAPQTPAAPLARGPSAAAPSPQRPRVRDPWSTGDPGSAPRWGPRPRG